MFAPENQIFYTSVEDVLVEPKAEAFEVNILSNVVENGLGVITFDAAVKSIGDEAFQFIGTLLSVTLPSGLERIGFSAFDGTSISEFTLPNSVTAVDDSVFWNCHNLQRFSGKFASEDGRCLIVGGVLKAIAAAALTEYTIPDGVETIGPNILGWDIDLEKISLPNSVKRICDSAFEDCQTLECVELNEGLEILEDFALMGIENLESITIPSTVKKIGNSIFYGCFALERVEFLATEPAEVSENFALGGEMIDVVVVPQESVEAYRTAKGWANIADKIVGNKDI